MEKPSFLSEPVVKDSTDPDMEIAQYLVQLSGEDITEENESSNSNNYETKSKNKKQNDISLSSSNTKEIVGRETLVFRSKKRRYRSIASIYRSTKPLEVNMQAKKMRVRC
ncbi:hypothetical protein NE237_017490 [Protea cynaroides]|uniref:Uncharacterized protein n=1 Tax=Protea cynaroides TaxID=273540 RepID=A0A9Q0K882_9MAGN|nr:hypothetical protein NE237_017490 [Protea cynaroides]